MHTPGDWSAASSHHAQSSGVHHAPARGITVHTPGAAVGIEELPPAKQVAWCQPTALRESLSLPPGIAMSQVPQPDALGMDWPWTPGKGLYPPNPQFSSLYKGTSATPSLSC